MNLKATLAKLGLQGSALALRMGTHGNGDIQRFNRWKSNSPTVISAECDIAQAAGIHGFIHNWDGPQDTFVHESMMGMWEECAKRNMPFAVMMDKWVAYNRAPGPTQAVIAALNHPDFQKVIKSKNYLIEKYIFEFNLQTVGVSMPSVQAAFPKYPILSEGDQYTWPQVSATLTTTGRAVAQPGPDPLIALRKQNNNPAVRVPALWLQFNDAGKPLPSGVNMPILSYNGTRDMNRNVWDDSPNRVHDAQGGGSFFDQVRVTPVPAKYIMLVTWDDFEEGTALLHFLSMFTGIEVK